MNRHCVFFDYGGTLEQTSGSLSLDSEFCDGMRRQLSETLSDSGRHAAGSVLETNEVFTERVLAWLDAERKRKRFAETERTSTPMWLEILGVEGHQVTEAFASVAEELSCSLETHGFHRTLRPHLFETIARLTDLGWQVGIISNVLTRRRVPREMDAFGLTPLFSPIVLSSEYGFRKPDPSIFHHAARLAGVPAKMCWHVGDTYSRDILGARRAGFAGVIRISGVEDEVTDDLRERFPDRFLEADATIEDLSELPNLLESALECRLRHTGPDTNGREAWVKGLLFDASDVLYHRPEKGSAFSEFLRRTGRSSVPKPPSDGQNGHSAAELKAFTGEVSREDHYREIVLSHGITDPDTMQEGIEALAADSDSVDFFPGIPETLRTLTGDGIRLGVVSNTILPLHDKLMFFEKGGFGDVWDSIILSVDVGARKPDPEIYLRAAEQLGLQPAECAFVGHEPYEISGARAAGMRTISFNCDRPIGAERHVEHFADLVDAVSGSDNHDD